MRLGILAALLCLLLAGCGDDDAPSAPSTGKVVLVSGAAAGGQDAGRTLERLDSDALLESFAAQFSEPLAQEIRSAAAKVELADGQVLAGAKVSEGCFSAVSAEVVGDELVGEPDAQEGEVQCIASITTVGLVGVPESLLGPAS